MPEDAPPSSHAGRVIGILLLLAAIAAITVFLATRPKPMRVPRDASHLASREEGACLSCHGPGRDAARSRNHPMNDGCFNCHAF